MTQLRYTIAALCTPPGDGGVAMIRLSGSQALDIAERIFSKDIGKLETHKLTYGQFLDADQKVVDSGLLCVMRAPHSYTGEEVVELFCHGGHLISQKVLECALKAGAHPARPGEFTERAYLNKKMDLTQAEAVQSLISAKNDYALKVAADQLEGRLSKSIQAIQNNLVEQTAILEAWVDFPDEEIEYCSLEELQESLTEALQKIEKLLETYEEGQALKNGVSLCFIGSPNVGKSSLMNQLLKKDRAIVTEIAGTTRDLLEETLIIQGMHYRILDTAGIRQSSDLVEKIGIDRALKAMEKADLTLLVFDASRPLNEQDLALYQQVKETKHLVIWNKMDVKGASLDVEGLEVSAKTSQGIDALFKAIATKTLPDQKGQDQIFLTEKRHKKALDEAKEYLQASLNGLQNKVSPEWLSMDLRSSLLKLNEVIGIDITENILSSIFSKFCIGK